MKKILIAVIIILFALPAYGQVELARMSPAMMGGSVPVAGVTCDSCAATIALAAHMDGAAGSDDVTSGDPCGCADTDTTATKYGDPTYAAKPAGGGDGTNALYYTGTYDYLIFDIAAGFDAEGTVSFSMYIDEFDDYLQLARIRSADGVNYIYIMGRGSDLDIEIQFYMAISGDSASLTTTTNNMQEDTWYNVVVKWKRGRPTATISITVVEAELTAEQTLPAFAQASSLLWIGSNDVAGNVYIDNFKLYSTWQ